MKGHTILRIVGGLPEKNKQEIVEGNQTPQLIWRIRLDVAGTVVKLSLLKTFRDPRINHKDMLTAVNPVEPRQLG